MGSEWNKVLIFTESLSVAILSGLYLHSYLVRARCAPLHSYLVRAR